MALRDDTDASPAAQNICMAFVQCWTRVKDVGSTLYKCYTNVSCLLGVIMVMYYSEWITITVKRPNVYYRLSLYV